MLLPLMMPASFLADFDRSQVPEALEPPAFELPRRSGPRCPTASR